jgi:hypothetical protein
MRRMRQLLRLTGTVAALAILAGCTYQAAIERLPPAERATFRAQSKLMSSAQVRTYLAKPTAAERAAYLEAIGTAQRFQALEPQDRQAVLAGYPREGMSAEAMRFLWGEPYYTNGYTGHYEHWYYRGSAFSLANHGSPYNAGTWVDVYMVAGRVSWWLEFVPSTNDDADVNGCPDC